MTIRKATIDDISELVRLRIIFLNEVNGCTTSPEGYKQGLDKYFRDSIADNSFAAWLACEGGQIIATSGVCFYHTAPNYTNPTGGVAYILNMFTLPEHRGQGLAPKLFAKLIEEAQMRGYKMLALHATAVGRKVYEKFGFEATDDEMVRMLE